MREHWTLELLLLMEYAFAPHLRYYWEEGQWAEGS